MFSHGLILFVFGAVFDESALVEVAVIAEHLVVLFHHLIRMTPNTNPALSTRIAQFHVVTKGIPHCAKILVSDSAAMAFKDFHL